MWIAQYHPEAHISANGSMTVKAHKRGYIALSLTEKRTTILPFKLFMAKQ